MRYIFIVLIALLFCGCEKQSYNTYIVHITSELSGSDAIGLERYQGNPQLYITKSDFKGSVITPSDQGIHVTAKYLDIQNSNKPITMSVSLSNNILITKTGIGSVDINIRP